MHSAEEKETWKVTYAYLSRSQTDGSVKQLWEEYIQNLQIQGMEF